MITDICRMQLLLVSATAFEIEKTRLFVESEDSGLQGLDIECLVSGVGMVPTAYALTRKIFEKTPALVIQAGIAGCTMASQIGKVYAIISDEMADLGVCEKSEFKSVFELGLVTKDEPPFEDGLLKNPNSPLFELAALEKCSGISVNEISTDPRRMEAFKQKYGLAVESMEGAALHFVCLNEKIPFLQIRAVSNEIGERDKTKWQLGQSIENLNAALLDFLKKLHAEHENDFRL